MEEVEECLEKGENGDLYIKGRKERALKEGIGFSWGVGG